MPDNNELPHGLFYTPPSYDGGQDYTNILNMLKGKLKEQEYIKQKERDRAVLEVLCTCLSSTPDNAIHAANMIINRVHSLQHQVRRLTLEIEVLSRRDRNKTGVVPVARAYCTFFDGSVWGNKAGIKCECEAAFGKLSPTCHYYREEDVPYNTDNDPLPDEAPPDFED